MTGGCGRSLLASLAWYDRDSCSWRTCQGSLLSTAGGRGEAFSGRWPRSGTMQSGVCSERPTPEPRSGASGFFAWPTPAALQVNDAETPEGWLARVADLKARTGNRAGIPLAVAVKSEQAWPTPDAHNGARGTVPPGTRKDGTPAQLTLNGAVALHRTETGQLNPDWVETLMGFPHGWTATDGQLVAGKTSTRGSRLASPRTIAADKPDCAPSATPLCRSARRSRSKPLRTEQA